jgi:hypothetical protein
MIEVITIERSAIDRLISAWPCHGISNRVDLIVAAFGDNGDLIDLEVCDEADVMLEPDAYDGPAMVALLEDAQRDAIAEPFIPGTIPGGRVYK